MDTKDWVITVGPIVGVIVGGLITSLMRWMEISKSREFALSDHKLARLESLNQRITEFLQSLTEVPIEAMTLCADHVSASERKSRSLELVQRFTHQSTQITTLIVSHAPKTSEHGADLIEKAVKADSAIFDFVNLHMQETVSVNERVAYFDRMKSSTLELAAVLAAIQTRLAIEIKGLLNA